MRLPLRSAMVSMLARMIIQASNLRRSASRALTVAPLERPMIVGGPGSVEIEVAGEQRAIDLHAVTERDDLDIEAAVFL